MLCKKNFERFINRSKYLTLIYSVLQPYNEGFRVKNKFVFLTIQKPFFMPFLIKNNLISVLVYSFIFVSGGVFAQKSQDSLSKYSYTELHYLILDSEQDSLLLHTYINEYKQKAFKEKNNKRISTYYKNFVFYQKEENRLTYIDSALHYAYKTNDKALIGGVYLTKGTIFYNIKDYQKALENNLKANDYISQTDDTYKKYRIKYHIAIIKNYLGNYEDAEKLFRECIAYFVQDETSYNMQRGYVNSLEGLAWSVLKTNHIEESNQILQTALTSIQKANFSELDGHYIVFKQGINDYFLNYYDEAIRKIQEQLPYLYENEDFAWATVGNFYIGKAYWDKNEKEKAIGYFEKVNEVFENQSYTHPDLRESYEMLIGYYESQNDKDNQLKYIKQLVKADSVYNQSYKHLIGQIHKEYETKDLLQTQKQLERSLYIEKYKNVIISVIASILAISVVFYVLRQKKMKRKAQELIKEIEIIKQAKVIPFEPEKIVSKPLQIDKETIQRLLENLHTLEKKQKFLKSDITLDSLAKKFKTNTAYLSSVINAYKNKNFSDYINNLRIDFILNELSEKDYETLKILSLDSCAERAGFSNRTTFSNAFKKQTGISPSVFLKELRKRKSA